MGKFICSLMTYPWQFPESVSPHLEKIGHTQKVAFPRAAAISVAKGKRAGVTAPNLMYYRRRKHSTTIFSLYF